MTETLTLYEQFTLIGNLKKLICSIVHLVMSVTSMAVFLITNEITCQDSVQEGSLIISVSK